MRIPRNPNEVKSTNPSKLQGAPKILLLGPKPIREDVIGGTKIMFAALVKSLLQEGTFDIEIINLSRPVSHANWWQRRVRNYKTFVKTLPCLWKKAKASDLVVLNVSSGGALKAGPWVWLVTSFRRKPLIIRFYGGDFDTYFDSASWFTKWLARKTFLRASLGVFETQALCDRFCNSMAVRHFPNSRNMIALPKQVQDRPCRYLFLSQLRPEKGIHEAVEASDCLPEGCSLTVYGPVMKGTDLREIDRHPNARYAGTVDSKNIPKVFSEHDVLLFPTYWKGEGIPGVLIEAMQCGVPVIATRWRSIGEVVHDNVNGLLVEPRSVLDLSLAMQRLSHNPELYAQLSRGARQTGEEFRSSLWHKQFSSWCRELIALETTKTSVEHAMQYEKQETRAA